MPKVGAFFSMTKCDNEPVQVVPDLGSERLCPISSVSSYVNLHHILDRSTVILLIFSQVQLRITIISNDIQS